MANFWNTFTGDGLIGGLLGLLQSGYNARQTAKNNKAQMQFAREENSLNRAFQAQQAEIGRDWEEEMYNKYYSPSAQMANFQQAGINPAQAVGQITGNGGASAPSASGGSSISPITHAPQIDFLSSLAAISQIKRTNAETKFILSQATGQDISNKYAEKKILQELRAGEAGIKNLSAATEKALAETANEQEKKGLIAFQKVLARAEKDEKSANALAAGEQALYTQWKNQFIKDNGYAPDSNGLAQVMSLIGSVANQIGWKKWGFSNLFDILGFSKP